MSFIHDDRDFDSLLRIVAGKRNLSLGLVEKDYWVTHTLRALHVAGFDIWFKGGTSLSKGFGLIERFSEDLDLRIEPGRVSALPGVSDWKSEGTKAAGLRQARFTALATLIRVPGAVASLDPDMVDRSWRSANIRVTYPGRYLADLAGVLKPFVMLEVGSARVTPSVHCDMTSFVHDELLAQGQLGAFEENRPKGVRCVHPLVTLLEKIDALRRRVPNQAAEPATFVRHYEDAARIIAAESTLPPLDGYATVVDLGREMLAQKQIAPLPGPEHPALALPPGPRTEAIRSAHTAIGGMFWGPRRTLDECAAALREWLSHVDMTR